MSPEEALAAARAELERLKAAGRYAEPEGGLTVEPTDRVSRAQLLEWALIEPDGTELRATRRGGAPITAVTRLLQRGLQQYHNELIAEQTRFNIHVLRRLFELEDRLDELEGR